MDPGSGELLDVDPADPVGLARVLAVQQQALLALRGQLDTLQQQPPPEDPAGDPDHARPPSAASRKWCWRSMDPSRTEQLWADLAGWVGWLRGRYPLAQVLPGCWWAHTELVEELTALYRAWLGAVAGGTPGTYNSVEWHDRWLPGTLARIRGWGADRCATGRTHQPKPPDAYTPTPVDDPTAFAAHVAADLAARRTSTAAPA
ncbi:MAG: hypothetical protein ACR2I1_08650 [Propionibacteriaceae bacterium]